GWEGEGELTKRFTAIFIRGRGEPAEIRRRIELTEALVAEKAARVLELHARGESRLEEMFSVLYVGEMASLYLALARGVDPFPTANIDRVKEGLAELGMARRAEEEVRRLMS
ncbi:hypothetical protein DRO33_05580, partial [Candidatus Bathyarchaeota archaeon]